jgi:GT2 family glycosyltransferase
MSDVEAVVLDIDGGESLSALFRSLARQTLLPSRVVVFDNGSSLPVSGRLPRDLPFEVRLERSDTNLGFTGGVNRAMRLVSAPFVALLNNDVVLEPGWMGALRNRFEEPAVAAVQSMILRPDGLVDGAGIDVSNGTIVQRGHGRAPGEVSSLPLWGVSATAALFRTGALRQVAYGEDVLHPQFFAYYEDVELSARLRAAGWTFGVVDEPLAVHAGSMSAGRLAAAAHLRVRNRYFARRLHRNAGTYRALLYEDARRIARAAAKFHVRSAAAIVRGVAAGLAEPIAPRTAPGDFSGAIG